jgi:hypothetical protein
MVNAHSIFDGLCEPDFVLSNSMMSVYGYQSTRLPGNFVCGHCGELENYRVGMCLQSAPPKFFTELHHLVGTQSVGSVYFSLIF